MNNFLKGFSEFILKGNVIDLAVAVIIGGAFGKIVESLVADIITPVILNPAIKAAQVENLAQLGFNGIQYGLFLSAVINFLVIAFCLYSLIQIFEKGKKKLARKQALEEMNKVTPPSKEELLLNAINNLASTIDKKSIDC